MDESSDDDGGDVVDAVDCETKRAMQALGLHETGIKAQSRASAEEIKGIMLLGTLTLWHFSSTHP